MRPLLILFKLAALAAATVAAEAAEPTWGDVLVSDERLKTNVTAADTAGLLEAVSRVQLREFDYVYEQFYNPIFGKRQLGIIAQEIKPLLPGSVGVIPKRSVSHIDDEDPTILTDVHVFHSENLFMAHIGATQELIQRAQTLRESIRNVQDALATLAQDASSGKQAHEALNVMRTKQDELEVLAKAAHERSEGAARLEQVLRSLEDASRSEQAERTALSRRVQDLHEDLRTEVKDQAELHRGISTDTASLSTALAQLTARFDENAAQAQDAQAKAREDVARIAREASQQAQQHGDAARADLDARLSEAVRAVATKLETAETARALAHQEVTKALQTLETSIADLQAQVGEQASTTAALTQRVDLLQAALDAASSEAARNVSLARAEALEAQAQTEAELADVRAVLGEMQTKVDAQAGEELVERRKTLEAEARIEEAKIELERTRTEEEEKRARTLADIEAERLERQENATLARVQQEEQARVARELQVAGAKEEAARREFERRAEHEADLVRAQAEAEVHKIRAQSDLERVRVLAQGEADAEQERANHELRKEMAAIDAQRARENTVAAIQATFQETIAAARMAAQSPRDVANVVGLLVLLAVGIYAGRESMIFWRKVFEHRLGKPSLVRETSQRGWISLAALTDKASSVARRTRIAVGGLAPLWSRASSSPKVSSSKPSKGSGGSSASSSSPGQRPGARSSGQPTSEDSFVSFMSDVVLPPSQAKQIERVARATRAAHVNGTPLRHLLFYGPPGTGKTMVARRLSKWCGLDYAIMSGADVAPLKDRAVTELHQLFEWAKRTPRGVALFIDEADAFLATRDGGSISESLRNALTALLYHTGAPSCRIMLILATNRPHDLDSAVLDRVDESVHFGLPSLGERRRIVRQYFAQTLSSSLEVPADFAFEEALEVTSELTEGFSGRELAKLMTSVQAHVYGSAVHDEESLATGRRARLSRAIYDQVLRHTVKEHAGKTSVLHGAT